MKECKEKVLKVLKNNRKMVVLLAVLLVAVIAVCATLAGNGKGNEKSSSNKKDMLANYHKTDVEYKVPLPEGENYDSWEYRDAFLNEDSELLMSLYKSAIDFAMDNSEYDGISNGTSYWLGVQKAVARFYGLESFKDEIVIENYEGEKCYKVGKKTVAEIGEALWGAELPEWGQWETTVTCVKYDSENEEYYFQITKPTEYFFTDLSSNIFTSHGTVSGKTMCTMNINGITTLSNVYAEEYSVKEYWLEIVYPADNRFGCSISALKEEKHENEMSLFQFRPDTTSVLNAAKVVNVNEYMDIVLAPYAYYRDECKEENEAIWLAIYNAINEYFEYVRDVETLIYGNDDEEGEENVDYGTESAYLDKLIMSYGYPSLMVDGDTEYIQVSENFVTDLINVYTGKDNLKTKSIPSYLKELISYYEDAAVYNIKIDDTYRVDLTTTYASVELDEGAYRVYCSLYNEEKEKLSNFYLTTYDNSNNWGFQMNFTDEYVKENE